MNSTKETIKTFEKYVIANYTRQPMVIVKGEGSRVWDADGKSYIDLFPGWGVCGLGHCHPAVSEALSRQASTLQHMPNNFYHPWQGELARLISDNSFGGKSFFCNSGAEAVEAAIKLARLHFKNSDILSIRFTIQVILFHTGGDTFHKSFAACNVEGITVKNFFNR